MKDVLLIQHLISLPHALKIIKTLRKKKLNAGHDFHYELIDLGLMSNKWYTDSIPAVFNTPNGIRMYGDYPKGRQGAVPLYHLKVYHTVAD